MSNKYNIIYNKNKYISGAGILILEKIDNKWTLILFKDHTNKFADVGGIYEKNHFNISDTASQELKEESRNLFILSDLKKLRKYIDIKHKKNNSYYRSFIIRLSDINLQDFNKNKQLIDFNINSPKCWKETTDVKKFYLEDLFETINNKNTLAKDINGEYHIIRNRLIEILKFYKTEINLIKNIPKSLNKIKMMHNQNNFLKDTVSYLIY